MPEHAFEIAVVFLLFAACILLALLLHCLKWISKQVWIVSQQIEGLTEIAIDPKEAKTRRTCGEQEDYPI
jgi:hypothetical protein